MLQAYDDDDDDDDDDNNNNNNNISWRLDYHAKLRRYWKMTDCRCIIPAILTRAKRKKNDVLRESTYDNSGVSGDVLESTY